MTNNAHRQKNKTKPRIMANKMTKQITNGNQWNNNEHTHHEDTCTNTKTQTTQKQQNTNKTRTNKWQNCKCKQTDVVSDEKHSTNEQTTTQGGGTTNKHEEEEGEQPQQGRGVNQHKRGWTNNHKERRGRANKHKLTREHTDDSHTNTKSQKLIKYSEVSGPLVGTRTSIVMIEITTHQNRKLNFQIVQSYPNSNIQIRKKLFSIKRSQPRGTLASTQTQNTKPKTHIQESMGYEPPHAPDSSKRALFFYEDDDCVLHVPPGIQEANKRLRQTERHIVGCPKWNDTDRRLQQNATGRKTPVSVHTDTGCDLHRTRTNTTQKLVTLGVDLNPSLLTNVKANHRKIFGKLTLTTFPINTSTRCIFARDFVWASFQMRTRHYTTNPMRMHELPRNAISRTRSESTVVSCSTRNQFQEHEVRYVGFANEHRNPKLWSYSFSSFRYCLSLNCATIAAAESCF